MTSDIMADGGVDALTMQGRVVRVRPVQPADATGLQALCDRASPTSRYLRFFSAGAPVEAEVARLTRPADDRHLALLVEDAGAPIAVGSYEVTEPSLAEFALLVDDARHGEGIGTLLL